MLLVAFFLFVLGSLVLLFNFLLFLHHPVLDKVEGTTEVANLCHIIFCHKDVERLEIPMYQVLAVHVLETQAQVDEQSPNKILI